MHLGLESVGESLYNSGMAIIKRDSTLPFSAAEMFKLVNTIEDYSDFMPWCDESEVICRSDDEVLARLSLSGGGISKSFTTRNLLQKDKMMEIRLVDGPFKHIEANLRFEDLEEGGCRVSLDMEFEFAGALMDMMIGPIFQQIASSLVDLFAERAESVYAKS